MPYNPTNNSWDLNDEMVRLTKEKKAGAELQLRKHADWNDNYELYRNKVRTNRLTQRQAINIPLMKETVKTLLSRIDDAPEVSWKENSGDELKELYYQEIWNQQSIDNKLELVDVLDKKNVLLYGLSVKKLNIYDQGVEVNVLDVFDVLLDPLMQTGNIETARFIVHQNIMRSVREILANDRYTDEGKAELKVWADSPPGIVQSNSNQEEWRKKLERLEAMGVNADNFAVFAGGDTIINLTEHFTNRWNAKKKKFERRVVVYAEDTIVLMDEALEDLLGVDFWPFVVWNEDPETNDIYPDSVADLVRPGNKLINVWYSQMAENRTLKNFQMHWYLPMQGYTPQTYTPGPGVMLPAPPGDDINKVLKPVEISGLDDTFNAINAVTKIVERGTGATAIEKGTSEKSQQTLGEIQILVGKAQERAVSMAKFYRMAWTELAVKWDAMMHANAPKFIKLYKQSASGKIYPKKVFSSDWVSKNGYKPIVRSSSETEQSNIQSMQKWMFVTAQNPNNPALREISMKRMLDLLDVTPEEMRQIEQGNKRMQETMEQQAQAPQAQPQEQQQPSQEEMQLQAGIQEKLAQLTG
jgi:hypothetical protein